MFGNHGLQNWTRDRAGIMWIRKGGCVPKMRPKGNFDGVGKIAGEQF